VQPVSVRRCEPDRLVVFRKEVVLVVSGWRVRERIEDAVDVEEEERSCHH
jgi:hypothetical protein